MTPLKKAFLELKNQEKEIADLQQFIDKWFELRRDPLWRASYSTRDIEAQHETIRECFWLLNYRCQKRDWQKWMLLEKNNYIG